jgi:hypothetical protein
MTFYREGIDKIKVLLNPLLLNKEKVNHFFDPMNKLSLKQAGSFTALSIQAEWFNPYFDYQPQIANAIYQLVKCGVLDFPDIPYLTLLCIFKYPYSFILNIVEVEFYSDFKKENSIINQELVTNNLDEAKRKGFFYQYHNNVNGKPMPTETYYSPHFNNISEFIFYNKLEKSKTVDNNKTTHKVLDQYQNELRAEFKLDSQNTDFLHWDNFRGNYLQIFKRHMDNLATIYYNKVNGIINFKCKENPNFKKVITKAIKNKPQKYNGKKLNKSYDYPEEKLHPDKVLSEIDFVQKKLLEYSKIDKIAKSKNSRKTEKNLLNTIENAIKDEEERQKHNNAITI